MKSVVRQLLWSVGGLTFFIGLLGAGLAFVAFQNELVRQKTEFLSDYVAERANKESRRFSDLAELHTSAGEALARRVATLSDFEAERLFNRYYPLQPDGTRRSAPASFDGMSLGAGDYSYGMGAFLAHGDRLSPLEKKVFVAAYPLVSHFGEAARSSYDNFYFFTPENRMVMFGPDRPDRLIFYRKTAPADLDFSHEQMVRLMDVQANPNQVVKCTNLQSTLSAKDKTVRRATACLTPVTVQGRRVGAFGSSIELSNYLAKAVTDTLPGAHNLIVTAGGEIIAYPGFTRPGLASDQVVTAFEKKMQLKALVARIHRSGRDTGVVSTPDGEDIVAYGHLRGPDWYFILSYPRSALWASAARSAVWVLLLGVAASVMMTALVVILSRKYILTPLNRIAQASVTGGGKADVSDIEARDDAIGGFARTLHAERTKVAELLESLEERVKARTVELERANEEKSRFLANMSHELRTPLNGVVAVGEMLVKAQTGARERELAEMVVSSGKLLEQVLTDILDFSKLEAGRMQLHVAPFDLEKVVDGIANLHGVVAAKKDVAYRVAVAPEAQGAYLGDSVRITQILSNLLSNATKFTEKGHIDLSVHCDEGDLVFTVEDTGVGFDEETGRRLFQRFEQADASTTRRYGGAGLGLAICAALTEIMGGSIGAESEPGVGSVFQVRLPLPRAADAAPEGRPQAAVSPVSLDGARVLLAEDHPTNQRVVRMILDAVGADLTVVENGRDALQAFEAASFDVILMDMQMPEMDGLTATAEIRRREAAQGTERTPVIMLTANALDDHVHASAAAGADRHVAKPMRPQTLLAAMTEVLGPQAPAQAARVA